jgi:hypothetical protein
MKQGLEQAAAGLVTSNEAPFKPTAERHQRIDLGDDAVLFGEGREGREEFRSGRSAIVGWAVPVVLSVA